ncbi:MAG: hypothetical protein IPH31_22000 [Lewinellaceae bacterium]|nr:hypothetical protein [Lewinellaceae bacterium]
MKLPFPIHLIASVVIGCACYQATTAQSVSILQRQAERSLAQGNYAAEAAAKFERAGRLNNSDPTLLYHAAEAYNKVRDYHNAANCYRTAKDDQRFPMANLRYARSLKQQGPL